MLLLLSAVFGLVVGSFLNVIVWRVPRHESIVRPGSHCPSCDAELGAIENVPVLSWLVLRGRCRHCRARISVRYPLVELANAALWVGIAQRFGTSWEVPAYCALASGLLVLSLIDLDHFLLPNRVLYPAGFLFGALLVLPAAIDGHWDLYLRAVEGGAAAFAVFFLIHIVSPRGMGFGDVRLSFVLGLALGWLSWGHVFLGLFLGFLLGAVVGASLIAFKLRGRKDPVPFGPFMAAGALVAIFAGTQLLDLYRGN
jgi:Type II secretory pathway, prepilin signal peptidase PulO and related peptidases